MCYTTVPHYNTYTFSSLNTNPNPNQDFNVGIIMIGYQYKTRNICCFLIINIIFVISDMNEILTHIKMLI